MKVFLVVISVWLTGNPIDGYQVNEQHKWVQMLSWEECVAMKHQREFLPPVGVNSMEAYFCVESNR